MNQYNTAYDYDIIDHDRRQYDDYNNYDEDYMSQDDEILPSLDGLSLHEIMGEDHYMHLTKNLNGSYNLEVSDEDAKPLVSDNNIHPFAVDSLALFCKRFLNLYSRFNNLHVLHGE